MDIVATCRNRNGLDLGWTLHIPCKGTPGRPVHQPSSHRLPVSPLCMRRIAVTLPHTGPGWATAMPCIQHADVSCQLTDSTHTGTHGNSTHPAPDHHTFACNIARLRISHRPTPWPHLYTVHNNYSGRCQAASRWAKWGVPTRDSPTPTSRPHLKRKGCMARRERSRGDRCFDLAACAQLHERLTLPCRHQQVTIHPAAADGSTTRPHMGW